MVCMDNNCKFCSVSYSVKGEGRVPLILSLEITLGQFEVS